MKYRFYINAILLVAFAFLGLSGFGSFSHPLSLPGKSSHHSLEPAHRVSNYGQLPMAFEPNQGQTDSQVQYLARGKGYSLFVTGQEAVVVLNKPKALTPPGFAVKGPKGFVPASRPTPTTPPVILRMKLIGAQTGRFDNLEKLPGVSNYFLGKDPSRWLHSIPQYGRVQSAEVYPGVDLAYYGNQGKLEYDFIVKPGADPGVVRIKYEGARSARVNGQGDLELGTSRGTVLFRAPSLYQESKGAKSAVQGHYRLDSQGQVGFEVDHYDATKPLVIDPVLDYSTFLGGTGYDSGSAIALDPAGDAYVTGFTNSMDFPVVNAGQGSLGGTQNAFVAEIDPTGTTMLYVTYFGGSGADSGNGIAVDSSGDAFIVGTTSSPNFPVNNALYGQTNSINDVFVSELGPGGASLPFSTYLGGTGNSGAGYGDYGNGIALDGSGNVYVTGYTSSADFPVTNAYQAAPGVGVFATAFVSEFNPTTPSLVYSTYLGGSYYDQAQGIAVDSAGNMFVTGYTYSPNFPVTNAAQSAFGGTGGFTLYTTINAFVTAINAPGTTLAYSTFLGGNNNDGGFGVAVDGSDNAYVTGRATSTMFPTLNPVQTALSNTFGNAFVCEIQPTGSLVYSTYLGGSGNGGFGGNNFGDYGQAIAVDNFGYAYVAGYTGSPDFPVTNSLQASLNQNATVFVTQFVPGGQGFLYSTYLGGTAYEQANGIAVDGNGNAYITGYTYSADFPLTVTPPQTTQMGNDDAFIAEISQAIPPTNTPTETPTITSTFTPTETPTVTPTATSTNTPTSTPTVTATLTSTYTSTSTLTFTTTYTPTVTSTTTPTSTPSFTPTVTSTFTQTQTPTFTYTPTITPTPTWTPTFTSTFTWTPSFTSTSTPTSTFTITPSFTPTFTGTPTNSPTPIISTVLISSPFPNPITGKGPVSMIVQAPNGSSAHITVFTLAFRKVYDKNAAIPGNTLDFSWNLEDSWGHPLADGLYYIRVQVMGPVIGQDIKKLLVIR